MSALTPRPGIMKIAPYVPGKDSVEGKQTIAKLSSNEGALGPSPKAMAAYAKAAAELHRYPDGASEKLRKAKYDLDEADIKPYLKLENMIDAAFETIVKRRADGILRMGDPLIGPGRIRTSELALKQRLPTMGTRREEGEAGLLRSDVPERLMYTPFSGSIQFCCGVSNTRRVT